MCYSLTLSLASLEPLPPRVLQISPIMSTFLEPTTTLKTTTEFAFIVGCTLGTCGPWIARGVDVTPGGSSLHGGAAFAASTWANARLTCSASARSLFCPWACIHAHLAINYRCYVTQQFDTVHVHLTKTRPYLGTPACPPTTCDLCGFRHLRTS